MAERKAINKYYPPDWDPSKGTVNQYVGQHPLRSRARKLDEGILIVRLALPFGIWCDGCNSLLAKGLRFNAEKKKARNYRSIPIWSFRIKCHSCSQQWIELQTNPEKFTYDVISGGRKKAEPEDATELDINYETLREEIIDMANGPGTSRTGQVSNSRLHELELVEYRKKRTAQAIEQLAQLKKESDKDWKNADQANSRLRELFR
ncbi:CWC16 protein, partial [Coemansia spiralis]